MHLLVDISEADIGTSSDEERYLPIIQGKEPVFTITASPRAVDLELTSIGKGTGIKSKVWKETFSFCQV